MSEIISGIYKITNTENNKVYIGSSKNIDNRWKQHKCLLRSKNHHSQHLQYSWDKYGKDSFTFEVIEGDILQEDLFIREQYWMDKLQSYNPKRGYNISVVAGSCIMNDNYNFEEIVDEEYELEHKYKTIYMVMNLKEKEIVYQKSNSTRNKCTFSDLIFDVYKYLVEINFRTWTKIILYNDEHQIEIHDINELPSDVCEKLFYNNDFQKIQIEDYRMGTKNSIYKNNFKWYKTEIDNNNNLDITAFDGFDLLEVGICCK